jgi:hypothetical protein
MGRRTIAVLGVVAGAALVIGAATAAASPDRVPTPTAAAPTSTPTALSDSQWHIGGVIQAINGQFWTVAGFVVRVNSQTRIESSEPLSTGVAIQVWGIVEPDGTWQATLIRLDSPDTPTPTSTPTPSATPTPTNTATATPTVTVTPRPTDTPGEREDDDTSARKDEENSKAGVRRFPPGINRAAVNILTDILQQIAPQVAITPPAGPKPHPHSGNPHHDDLPRQNGHHLSRGHGNGSED